MERAQLKLAVEQRPVVYGDDELEQACRDLQKSRNTDERKAYRFATRIRRFLAKHHLKGKKATQKKMRKAYSSMIGSAALWQLGYAKAWTIWYVVGENGLKIIDVTRSSNQGTRSAPKSNS